jgi:hypothetical protein
MNTVDGNNEAPPTEQTTKPELPIAILVKLKTTFLLAYLDSAVILSNLYRSALCGALRQKGLLSQDPPSAQNQFRPKDAASVTTRGNTTFALIQVTDLKRGMETIRDELVSLEASAFAEIGYLGTDCVWHAWQPPDAETDFPAAVALMKSWFKRDGNPPPQ